MRILFEFQNLTRDGILREDTSLEKLAKLKTVLISQGGYANSWE